MILMAVFSADFYSTSLCRFTGFRAILPNDLPPQMRENNPHFSRPVKTLYLLHGYSGTDTDWLINTRISELSGKYNLAVVCPRGTNDFYLDGPETGRKYGTFVGEELPDYISQTFGLSEKRGDCFIGGFSMGGFGAIHTALAYPERFSRVISFSAALIQHNVERMKPGDSDATANYDYYRLVFGPPEELAESPNNPDFLLRELLERGGKLPDIFMCVGTEDFLYGENQLFRQLLTDSGVDFVYRDGPGVHDFNFVGGFLEEALKFLTEDW